MAADTVTVSLPDGASNLVLISKKLWVVSDDADRVALESWSVPVAQLGTMSGGSLSGWTKSWKYGDWSGVGKQLNGVEVWLALPPWDSHDEKVKNLLKALTEHLSAFGAKVVSLDFPNGETLASHLEKGDTPDTVAHKIAQVAAASASLGSTASEELFNIALSSFDFLSTADGVPFLVLKEGPRYAWGVNAGEVGHFLLNRRRETTGAIASRKDIGDCLAAIEATCREVAVPASLHLRSARSVTGNYWIDLGGTNGYSIRLSAEGWQVMMRPDADVFFRRTRTIHELPYPAEVDPDRAREILNSHLRRFVNVSDEDWPLLVAWMVTHLLPGLVPPIALLVSEADAGKSTATMAVRFAVEGALTKGAQMSSKVDDIAVTMAGERLTVFNNVSKITKEQSDFLCQVVDGTEYKKRKLHTDADVAVLEIQPSVLMNGITTGHLKSDFKTRAVRLELKPIYMARMSDEEIQSELRAAHSEIFGCLLSIAVDVLRQLMDPGLKVPDPQPRMIDYARVLTALDRLWGLGGGPLRRFSMSLDDMSADAVDDLLFKVVHGVVVRPEFWNEEAGGYVAEIANRWLREQLNSAKIDENVKHFTHEKRGMFETGEILTASIRKAEPDWKRLGVHVEKLGQLYRHGQRDSFFRFTFIPRGETTPWHVPSGVVLHLTADV